jgi:hypothetical protein
MGHRGKYIFRELCFNPILHTAWLDYHALTLKEILQNIILVKNPVFLHAFLKISCESRKISAKKIQRLSKLKAINVFKKVNLNIWQTCHDLF